MKIQHDGKTYNLNSHEHSVFKSFIYWVIHTRFVNGFTVEQIAEEMSYSVYGVKTLLNCIESGEMRLERPYPLVGRCKMHEDVCRLFDEGLSTHEIAGNTGVSVNHVYTVLRYFNRVHLIAERRSERNKKIYDEYLAGKPKDQLEIEYDLSEGYVHQIIKAQTKHVTT